MRTLESSRLRFVGHSDLAGCGDGMQIMKVGDALYVGHLGTSKAATSVLDVSDPATPRMVKQFTHSPGSHSHKVQTADGLLLVNEERFRGGDPFSAGMFVYDIADPFTPEQIGYFRSGGKGVHRIVWTGGRYAYTSAVPDGFDDRIFLIVDVADPEQPREVGRWWWPGTRKDEDATVVPAGKRYAAHHALLDGDVAYLAYGDAGLVVLDLHDPSAPQQVGHLAWSPGGDTHTCMPLPSRSLVVVTDEAVKDRCEEEQKLVRILDVSDATHLRVVGTCPPPQGDFCDRGLRFGPHNLHENRHGSYMSESLIFVTYFNAGLRVYDIGDPAEPVEIAYWVPEAAPGQPTTQINDLFVGNDGTIFVTDRVGGGLYVLRPEDDLLVVMEAARL